MNRRKEMGKKDAMKGVLNRNLIAILTSALILASAGFCLKFTSSNPIVAEPVSYTHLDVYKRQGYNIWVWQCNKNDPD